MNVTKEISRKEAIAILCRYYGQETEVTTMAQDGEYVSNSDINSALIDEFENSGIPGLYDTIQSFRFTSLRSIDEMTEDEKKQHNQLSASCDSFDFETSESIDYLRAQGIATNNENTITYIIKD